MGSSISRPALWWLSKTVCFIYLTWIIWHWKKERKREREREREKEMNELSLLLGWAQCIYYLRLTGCETIHFVGSIRAAVFLWVREGKRAIDCWRLAGWGDDREETLCLYKSITNIFYIWYICIINDHDDDRQTFTFSICLSLYTYRSGKARPTLTLQSMGKNVSSNKDMKN